MKDVLQRKSQADLIIRLVFSCLLVKDILPYFVAAPEAGMDNTVHFIADELGFLADREEFKFFMNSFYFDLY